MGGGLPRGPQSDSFRPVPYISLCQFLVVAVDAVFPGQPGERQIRCQAKLGSVLLGEVGDQNGSGKEGRKLRAAVSEVEIGNADAKKRDGKVERAFVHRPANERLYARLF